MSKWRYWRMTLRWWRWRWWQPSGHERFQLYGVRRVLVSGEHRKHFEVNCVGATLLIALLSGTLANKLQVVLFATKAGVWPLQRRRKSSILHLCRQFYGQLRCHRNCLTAPARVGGLIVTALGTEYPRSTPTNVTGVRRIPVLATAVALPPYCLGTASRHRTAEPAVQCHFPHSCAKHTVYHEIHRKMGVKTP